MSAPQNMSEMFNGEARRDKIISATELQVQSKKMIDRYIETKVSPEEFISQYGSALHIPARFHTDVAKTLAQVMAPQHIYVHTDSDCSSDEYVSGQGMMFNFVVQGLIRNDPQSKAFRATIVQAFDACADHRDKLSSGKLVPVSRVLSR